MSGFLNTVINGGLAATSQSFTTLKIPNLRLALYTLTIRNPGFALFPFMTYIFPLSPSSIRKPFTAMSSIFDTSGPPSTNGVTRSVDSFGMAPVMYTIEGTTGWDVHQTDGFTLSGTQSIQKIQYMLNLYTALNQQQKQANNPNLYSLEFYDYFNAEYWQVEPIGDQEIMQSERAPLLQYYRFRLAGIQPVAAAPPPTPDPTSQLFSAAVNARARSVTSVISGLLSTY